MRLVELGRVRRTSYPCGSFAAIPRQSVDSAIGRAIDANTMILGVGDQHIARAVDAEMLGLIQGRPAGIAAITVVARPAGAGDSADLA